MNRSEVDVWNILLPPIRYIAYQDRPTSLRDICDHYINYLNLFIGMYPSAVQLNFKINCNG